ncbi:MAG: TRAP transporter small permease subunit [Acidobacteriota bacterium]
MRPLVRAAHAVDRLTVAVGQLTAWLTLVMVLVGAFNAIVRYLDKYRLFDHSLASNTYIELQWYLFSLVFLLGAAYTLQRDRHVRVDVVYGRLGRRAKAWIDVVGTLVLMLPFCVFTLWVSWPSVRNSWQIREMSPDPGGLPRYPIKAVILVAFVLLLLQGLSMLIRSLAVALGDADDQTDVASDDAAAGVDRPREGWG